MIAIDTDLLVYAHRRGLPEHRAVCTSTPGEAAGYLAALIEDGGAELWRPGPDFGTRLVRHARDLSMRGSRIFELQIAPVALEHGASEVWTHDRALVAQPGLRVRDPLVASP